MRVFQQELIKITDQYGLISLGVKSFFSYNYRIMFSYCPVEERFEGEVSIKLQESQP